jgi:hypothetical protein
MRFTFLGVNCFPFFNALLTKMIEHGFRKTLKQVKELQDCYEKLDILAILVPDDEPVFHRLCVLVAKRMEQPSLVIGHGLLNYPTVGHAELMTADQICVVGEADFKEMRKRRPDTPIHIIGCLQFDQYRMAKGEGELDSDRAAGLPLRILVLTLPTNSSARSRSIDPEVYLKGVAQALNPFTGNIRVTFKLHPSENISRYKAALEWLAPQFACTVEGGHTLPILLPRSDLVIAPASTAVAEALFLRKPVIYYRVQTDTVPPLFQEGSGLMTAGDADELARHVAPAVTDYRAFLRDYDFESPRRFLGPLDGSAGDRLADAVEAMLREPERQVLSRGPSWAPPGPGAGAS